MSITSGVRSGLQSGLRSGLDPSYGGASMAGVAQDGAVYVPANGSQWTTTMTAAGIGSGNPTSLWLCQEASGNLADSIGANTLTAFGSVSYAQAVAGWTRKGLQLNSTAAMFSTTVGNTATTSYMLLAYIAVVAPPAAADAILNVGLGAASADRRAAAITPTPAYRAQGTGVTAVNGASNAGTSVRPVVLLFNRAGSEFSVLTDQEKILTTYVAPTDGTSSYVSLGDGAHVSQFLYAAMFSGTAAQLSRTQVKTLLQTLGWSIAWTP